MGQFLTILSRQKKSRPELQFFYNHSLSKIAQFYQQYKTISDTLAIDDSEFTQIFGHDNLSVFDILDTDKNLLIDGLELFAGLVLYSKMIKFEDKIQFLFNLFDFNEQNSLFPNDIEFMFLSCCTFTHKIYGLRSQLNQVWIEEFVRGEFFNGEVKINISEILRWSRQSAIITIFFEEILARPQTDTSSILDKKTYIRQFSAPDSSLEPVPVSSLELHQKQYEKYLSKVKDKLQTFHEEKLEYTQSDVCFDVNWAYGIRLDDIKRVVKAVEYDNGEIEIIYLVGKLCVLFNKDSKTQRHYRQHKLSLISLQTNETRKLIATGEQGRNPAIRIWSYQTLHTLHVLPTNHKNSIHIMNFSKDGNFLVHVGCSPQGTFNIHNLVSNELIISCYCKTPIVDISELDNFTNIFIIESLMTGLYEVSHMSVTVQEYKEAIERPDEKKAQVYIKQHVIEACEFMSDGKPISKITCSAFLMLNRNLPYLEEYDSTHNKYILTGHEKGEVNVWNAQFRSLQFQLYQEKAEIIKLVVTRDYVIVISDSSYISFWDVALEKKQRIRVIDITEISYHLHSYNVRDLVPLKHKDQYLVCTAKGDVFILGQEVRENEVVKFSLVEKDYEVELVEQIFPIEGRVVGAKLLSCKNQGRTFQQLFYGGQSGVIFTINATTHLRVSAWNIGENIVSFDVAESKHQGTVVVAATSANKVYTKLGSIESSDKLQLKDQILCLLLSPDASTLIVSTHYYDKNNVLIFNMNQKLAFQLCNTVPLPEKIIYMELVEKKSVLCVTQNNSVLLLSLKDLHFKPFDQLERSFPNPVVNLVYHLKQKQQQIPIIVGAATKAIMMGRLDGTILAWRNQDDLELGSRVDLYAHNSYCSSLLLDPHQTCLYSAGFSDNLLVEWSLRFFMEMNSAISGHLQKIEPMQEDEDEFLERETTFCVFRNNLLTEMYDQHLLVRGIGSNNDTLSKLFKSMLQQWKILNQTSPNIRSQPNMGLKLDFVLGMQVFSKTQTVLSLNQKKIAFFVSRVVVIYNPNINKQEIYTGHRFKVTCIHRLQGRKGEELIASGESSFRPRINIWSTDNLETIKIINTSHCWGIINIAIHNGRLLSYGLYQNDPDQTIPTKSLNYQFQSIDIWTNQPIASLVIKHPAYCMRLHPTKDEIVVSTYGCVVFYTNDYGHYRKKSICYVDDEHVTCMQFCEIKANNRVEHDLLVGTRKGTIGMICQERNFIVVRSRAHQQRINCMLKININKDTFFVTTSEDQMMKIWSKKFILLYYSEMKKTESDEILKGSFDRKGTDVSYLRNRAVQSLTVFSMTHTRNPTLLLGTRNGDIFEFIIETDFAEKDPFRNSKYLLYSKNNITQSHLPETKKVLLAHHPKLEIIVTIGQDQNLLFWDTEASGGGSRYIFSKYLGYTSIPTAMKFTKDGDFLIIGFSDGLLIFLDSKIAKSIPGKTDDKFLMPSLSLIKKDKAEQGNAVLNMELSDSGEHLAVSYNYRIVQTKDKKPVTSNSSISLFNKKSQNKVKNFSKMNQNEVFEKFTAITCPYAESVYRTEKNNQYGMAAYSMTFAEGEGKFYLLIYYQLVDCAQNRLNYATEGKYSVWDVSTSTMIANLDLVGSLSWKKLCFQNSIFSRYVFWKNLIEHAAEGTPLTQPVNNNLYVPHMSALINIQNHLIMGSVNGDLHIVKSSALELEGGNPQHKDMFIAKTFPGHCSEVNQIQINPEKVYLYTTSVLDECIFKFRLEGTTRFVIEEQAYNDDQVVGDLFGEVPTVDGFSRMLTIYEDKEKRESRAWIDKEDFLQKMFIADIIGRRASTIRQNVFIDCGRSLIYHIGQAIINWNPESKRKKFIYPSDSSHMQLNDITQLGISHDNRSVVAAHSGIEKAAIVVWQTNCKNTLKEFFVNGMCYVIIMALNHDNSRIVFYGMDKIGKAFMVLVDLNSYRPLAVVSYSHKPAWIIKAIHFAEQSQSIFYTCGVEQTKKWTFSGNQLTYQQINSQSVFIKKVIHLSMLVMNKVLITGTDDGDIVLWKAELSRKQGHESMVTCLARDKGSTSNLFYSGGKDGYLVMWAMQPNALVMTKKISILNTLTPLEKHNSLSLKQASFAHQIQSICCYRSQLAIGTRNGNIYHSSYESLTALHEQTPVKEVFAFHDFQVTQALFFNPEETELYEISKNGLFSIWLIREQKHMYSNAFREETVDMAYHGRSKTVFVAFKKQLRVFYVEKEDVGSNQQPSSVNIAAKQGGQKIISYKLRELPQLSLSLKFITHLAFSNNQKMLALAIQSNSDQSIFIEIYEVPEDIKSARTQLKRLFVISLKSPIRFIDFSLNNKYLLISSIDSTIIRDLAENKSVNQELIAKIQWYDKGVMYGHDAEVAVNQWNSSWGTNESTLSTNFNINTKNSKTKPQDSKGSMKGQKAQKPSLSQLQEKQKKQKQTNSHEMPAKKHQGQSQLFSSCDSQTLLVCRLQNQRFLLIQKWGSLYIYHMQNMISKVNLPLTTIDHFSVSPNRNFVAVACQVDRMIVIVDVRKCMVRNGMSQE